MRRRELAASCARAGSVVKQSCTMTRQIRSLVEIPSADKRALLRPLVPARNLTDEVTERIKKEIGGGRLLPGARLPTEQELMTAMGVSRTVVREAVAALRADGLVTTRQGSGAYVAADVSRVPFRIDPEGLSSIDDVLAVMELRQAIEVEAAALAAERITPRRLAPMSRALRAIEIRHSQGRGCRQRGLRLPSRDRRSLRQSALRRAPGVSRAPRHSAPERSHCLEPAGGAAAVSDAHSKGAWAHSRSHSQRRPWRCPQGDAPSPDRKPQALPPARRAAVARGVSCRKPLQAEIARGRAFACSLIRAVWLPRHALTCGWPQPSPAILTKKKSVI